MRTRFQGEPHPPLPLAQHPAFSSHLLEQPARPELCEDVSMRLDDARGIGARVRGRDETEVCVW